MKIEEVGDSYTRDHVIKVCRDKCMEIVVYESELDLCVKECVKNIIGDKDSD